MTESVQPGPCWEIAADPDEVHALLQDSDAEQARRYGLPTPQRNPATTAGRVRAGQVHLIRLDGRAVGAFTLSTEPPFAVRPGIFPATDRPWYLSRLCVAGDQLRTGSLVGVRCLREAIAAAGRGGATALRSQANPDFTDVFTLLRLHGFRQHGAVVDHGGPLRAVNLQKDLVADTGR